MERSEFGAADLERYQAQTYGVDLPERYGERPFLLAWSRGDGQAYVTLAADPLAQQEVRGLGISLYRYSRVGYAWLASLVVGGRSDLIPYGLIAVSLGALGALGWVAATRYDDWGKRSLILLVVPGVLISTATDTAEALGLALASVAVTLSPPFALAAAAFLGIVRPDFATALLLRGREGIKLAAACAMTAIGIRVFGLMLGLEWTGLHGTMTLPLVGFVEVVSNQSTTHLAITVGLAAVALITIGRGVIHETGWTRVAHISTGIFVLTMGPIVLEGAQNSLRAASALWLLWAVPLGHTVEAAQPPEAGHRYAATQ